MILPESIRKRIVSKITEKFKVKDIILFGSYAQGNAGKNSDIDILVLLNENGITPTYMEKIKKRMAVSSLISDVEQEIPVDLLVYTIDEWQKLTEVNNSFIRRINKEGIKLL